MIVLDEYRNLPEKERRERAKSFGPIHFADDKGKQSFCGTPSPRNWMTPDGAHGETVATWICGNCQPIQARREGVRRRR
jgi:hypothetical protein